jgi:hypothetical protein
MIYQFNSFDDSLHCFVEGDVEPPGHPLVEPGVAVPQFAVVRVRLEKLVAESEEKKKQFKDYSTLNCTRKRTISRQSKCGQ